MTIRKAKQADANKVLSILLDCAHWLADQGLTHWKEAHTLERVVKRIKERNVFLLEVKGSEVATITLDNKSPSYYRDSDKLFWSNPDAAALYISSLAVLPESQGGGLATQLLTFAEEQARKQGLKYIRFDAVAHYKALTRFYVSRGYRVVGSRVTGKENSNFFEKAL